jgi:hypothetical protein
MKIKKIGGGNNYFSWVNSMKNKLILLQYF